MGIKSKKLEYFSQDPNIENSGTRFGAYLYSEGQLPENNVWRYSVARFRIVMDNNGASQLTIGFTSDAFSYEIGKDSGVFCAITTDPNVFLYYGGTSEYEFKESDMSFSSGMSGSMTITKNLIPGETYYVWLFVDDINSESHNIDYGQSSTSLISASGSYSALSSTSCQGGYFGDDVSIAVTQLRGSNASTQVYFDYTSGGTTTSTLIFGPSSAKGTSRATFNEAAADYASTVTNAMECSAVLRTVTSVNGTVVGTTQTQITMRFKNEDVAPSCAAAWVSLAPYNPSLPSSIRSYYIKTKSKIQATFDSSKITYRYGASFVSFSILYDGETNSTSPYVSTKYVGSSNVVTCRVTDSRGAYTDCVFQGATGITITDYSDPFTTNNVVRCDVTGNEDEDETSFRVDSIPTFSSINSQNTITITVNYRAVSEDYAAANETEITQSGGQYSKIITGPTSPDIDYEVRVTITDLAGGTSSVFYNLFARNWAMKFNEDGTAVGFGMAPIDEKTLQIPEDWDIRIGLRSWFEKIYPIGSLYMSTVNIDPSSLFGGFWRRIKDRFLLASGDTYSLGETDGSATAQLGIDELPEHDHTLSSLGITTQTEGTGESYSGYVNTQYHGGGYVGAKTGTNGLGKAFSIMPPYLAVNIWEKIGNVISTITDYIVRTVSAIAAEANILTVSIEPAQRGSGNSSPSNVRSISGYDSAKLIVSSSENLFNNQGWVKSSSVIKSVSIPILFEDADTQYTFYNTNADLPPYYIYAYDDSGTLVGRTAGNKRDNFTVKRTDFTRDNSGTKDYASIRSLVFRYYSASAYTAADIEANCTIMLIRGGYDESIQGTYIPFSEDTYPVSFGSAGTVYSGSLDVLAGNLTVDSSLVTYDGSETWGNADTEGAYYVALPSVYQVSHTPLCDKMTAIAPGGSSGLSGNQIRLSETFDNLLVRPDGISSVEDWKTWLASNPMSVLYKLKTPSTYQLTAQQVALAADTNLVFANCGKVTLGYISQ